MLLCGPSILYSSNLTLGDGIPTAAENSCDGLSRCPLVQFSYLVCAVLKLVGFGSDIYAQCCFRVQLLCLLHNGASNRISDQ